MWRFVPLALIASLTSATAQTTSLPATGSPVPVAPATGALFPTNVLQTCGPVTGTLSAVGNSVVMPDACAGFGTYIITVTKAAGDAAFVGTFASTDAKTGGPRRLHKTGVGALQNSSEMLTGSQSALLEYRTCGGAGPQAITATAYTSGRATVTITGMVAPTACFVNGSVQSPEESALRANKAFSVFTGNQVVTAGQYMSMLFSNPAGSGVRAIITYRGLQCDNPTSVLASKWWGIRNATTNLPTTSLTPSNRGNSSSSGGVASTMAITYTASATTYPDTSPVTALTARPGGMIPTGGIAGGPLHRLRTVEAGQSTSLSLLAIAQPSGLGTANPTCQIEMDWYEEAAQ